MFRNYFKTAWQNLVRNKTFSVINILGLSSGLACSILIFLWVNDEKNIDKFNSNKNIYDIYESVYSNGAPQTGYSTPGLLATEIKRNIPEIKYASAFWNSDDEDLFSVGDKNLSIKGCHADSDFFKIFNYPLLEGDAATALSSPEAIAISKKMADNFFGSPAAAMGKTIHHINPVHHNNAIRWEGENFKITAVFEVPANTSQKFDFALNWYHQLATVEWLRDWINRSPNTFVQLEDGADPAKVRSKIKDFITPYLATANYGSGNHVELGLQKYTDMYLNSTFKNGLPDGGRIEYVKLFTIIAVFILLIACINFMNLATARSVKRAKEVGIRKTIGAIRRKLIVQFIGEAMLFTFFAVLISLAFVFTSLPYFNNFTNKQIQFPFLSFSFWLDILALLCLTGFVAGSYPAIFLSSLNPVKVLKGSLRFTSKALLFRKGLVVIQFVVSIALIIGTIVVSQQVNFVQTANLGYNKENLVYIPFQGDLGNRYETFKQQLLILPGVTAVDISAQAPSDIDAHVYDLEWQGKDPNTRIVGFHNGVGYDYAQTMGLQLINGRFFSRAFPSDTSHAHPNLVINETLSKILGFKNPVGQHMQFFGSIGTIIGVVKDFHFKSLHESIQPLVLYEGEGLNHGYALIKIEAGRTQQVITGIEQIYKQLEANYPFRYYFADDEYRKLYSSEIAVRKLSDGFSFFAIFISSLGLLGLSIFTAEQRRKEIGVRKVIGASVTGIITMLSTDTVKLVLIATVIASPLSWFALNIWLQGFAYRINISWWIFVIAGIVALLIALLTISWQAIKAALANPAMSLRTE